jgi:hypothetical protein
METVDIKIINIEEGITETVDAEPLENGSFKLMSNPVASCRLNYGTIIRAEKNPEGDLVMTRVVRASDFRTRKFFLNASLNSTELREKIGDKILEAGGEWEVVFGHLPKDSNFDLDMAFKNANYFPSEITDD